MADIDIQRKGPSVWLWILGLLAVALVIWLLVTQWGADERVAGVDPPVAEAPIAPVPDPVEPVAPAAVQQFSRACVVPDAQQRAGLDHEFTVGCLRQLADAIDATAEQRGVQVAALQPQTQEVREHAQQLEALPVESLEHSNHARLGAMAAVAALQTLNQAPGTADAAAPVGQAEQAAQTIASGEPLLEQTDALNRFFAQAHAALQTLAAAPGAGTPAGTAL